MKRILLHEGLSALFLLLALSIFKAAVVPADVADSWYPVPLVFFLVFLAFAWLHIPQGDAPQTTLLIIIYRSLGFLLILVALTIYVNDRDQIQVLNDASFFVLILLYAAFWAVAAIPYFFRTPFGQKITANRLVQGLTVSLLTVILVAMVSEGVVRNDYMKRHVLGAYPITALPELNQPLNSWDFPDVEHSIEKPEGTIRVIILGDSLTAGSGLWYKDRYASLLQEKAGEDVEIIVLANPAASTAHQLIYWEALGRQLEADIVIVGVVTNDPDMGLVAQEPDETYFVRFFPDSQFARFLDYQINRWRDRAGQRYSYGQWESDLYTDEATQTAWKATLRELYQSITATGAEAWAYTLISPFDYSNPEIEETYRTRYEQLESAFREAGFRTTNLYTAYRERFDDTYFRELWVLPNDGHPDDVVNAFYAEAIWQDLAPALSLIRESAP